MLFFFLRYFFCNPSFVTLLVFLIAFSCSITITQSRDLICLIKCFTSSGVAIDSAGNAFAVGSGNSISSTKNVDTVFYSSYSASKFSKWTPITPPCKLQSKSQCNIWGIHFLLVSSNHCKEKKIIEPITVQINEEFDYTHTHTADA